MDPGLGMATGRSKAADDTFIGNINADERLNGRFSYQVNVAGDGTGRVHIGQWDTEETLAHVHSQPYFAEFAGKVKEFSGGGPDATRFKLAARTETSAITA